MWLSCGCIGKGHRLQRLVRRQEAWQTALPGGRPLPLAHVQCGPEPLRKRAFLILLRGKDLGVMYKGSILEAFASRPLIESENPIRRWSLSVRFLFPVVHAASQPQTLRPAKSGEDKGFFLKINLHSQTALDKPANRATVHLSLGVCRG